MKMLTSSVLTLLIALELATQTVQAQFQELVKRVPSTANALVFVNAEKLFESPISQSQNWKSDRAKRFSTGLSNVPPLANQLLLASQLDLEFMRPVWEAALLQADAVPPLEVIARQSAGTLDQVADLPAVRLSDDSYLLQFSDKMVGVIAPAARQLAARWAQQPANSLSPYLTSAAAYAERSAGVLMALDLTDALNVTDIENRLAEAETDAIKNTTVDKKELAQVLASAKGVMLGITFTEKIRGRIVVDFGRDASSLAPVAKPLVLEILSHRGAMIDEFANWNANVAGSRMTFDGELTTSGMTRLSSLIEMPTQALSDDKKSGDKVGEKSDNTQEMAQATQQYFKSIDHLSSDLKGMKGEAKTIGQIGRWYDNYARKVDRLPMVNVDPKMLDYGAYVAAQLRNASMAIKGVGIRTRAGEVNAVAEGVTNSYSGGYAGYGGYGYYGADWTRGMTRREQQSARTQVRASEKATGAADVQQIRQQIQEATALIRREMTQKYQIEF